MPDPKALAEAIRTDLEAVGFTVTLQTEPWRPDYLGEYGSAFVKFQSYLFGTICDWATIDNFLQTFHFGYVNGKPFQDGLQDDVLNQTMIDAANAKTDAEAAALWGKAQDLLAADMPEVPLINVSPPAAAQRYVQGFVSTGTQLELLNTVWLNK
jgi:ABC-type transport system substrate-binding protein